MDILLIEDDPETADYVADGLRAARHRVEVASDGTEGLFLIAGGSWDLVIVDRMLPNVDGLAIVRTMRRRDTETPVLFLTAMDTIDDRVRGLEAGGDDYLVKPFAFAELQARVEALGRRRSHHQTVLRVADLEMNLISRTVRRAAREIDLQHREFQLLECLMRQAGQVVTRKMLLETVWGFHFDPHTNIIETHVSRLRGKVDIGFEAELIHTVRNVGYSLRAPQ